MAVFVLCVRMVISVRECLCVCVIFCFVCAGVVSLGVFLFWCLCACVLYFSCVRLGTLTRAILGDAELVMCDEPNKE